MAKKVQYRMRVTLAKNTIVEKGGAWLCIATIFEEGQNVPVFDKITAWANPSAAKRYLKVVVLENTPRKSIKLEPIDKDSNDKPIHFRGELLFKAEPTEREESK